MDMQREGYLFFCYLFKVEIIFFIFRLLPVLVSTNNTSVLRKNLSPVTLMLTARKCIHDHIYISILDYSFNMSKSHSYGLKL